MSVSQRISHYDQIKALPGYDVVATDLSGYYTSIQTDGAIATAVGNLASVYAPLAHTHDDRYYTETESDAALALKAPLNSPTFTGTPTAPTAAQGTNTTQLATAAFVRAEVSALVNGAPETLDQINELAAAIGSDPNFAVTVAGQIGAVSGSLATHAADTAAHGATSANTASRIVARGASGEIAVGAITADSETLTGAMRAGNGTAVVPGMSFASDTNLGWYRIASDTIGLSCGNSLQLTISPTAATFVSPIVLPNGSATAPGFGFASTPALGLYRDSATGIGFTTGSASTVAVISTNTVKTSQTGVFGWTSNSNASGSFQCGISRIDPLVICFGNGTTGNASAALSAASLALSGALTAASGTFSGIVTASNGSAGAPSYCFTSNSNMGMYRIGSTGGIGFAVSGAQAFQISSTGVTAIKYRTAFVALTDAANIATNSDLGSFFSVTLTATRNFSAPTGTPLDGDLLYYRIRPATFDATWDAAFRFSGGTAPVLSGTVSYVAFRWNSTDLKWDDQGGQLNL